MNSFRGLCVASIVALIVGSAAAQLPGKKPGNNNGGGGSPPSTGGGSGGSGRGPSNTGGGSGGGHPQNGGGSPQNNGGSQGGGIHSGGGLPGKGSSDDRGGSRGSDRPQGGDRNIIIGDDSRIRDRVDWQLGKKSSRSGTVRYEGSNNFSGKTDERITIGRAPVSGRRGIIEDRVNRKERISLNHDGLRDGYIHYDRRWCDDYFSYPYYTFSPYGNHCVISPWYYYASLPAYVVYDRCSFHNYPSWSIWSGNAYNWQQSSYYDNNSYGFGRMEGLDYALEDIVNAFERQDRRAVSRLVPDRAEVAIYVDGQYSYSLRSDDFYDMFLDAVQNTRTRSYRITQVQTNDNCARVTARHDYEDPWGRRTTVWHYYELQRQGRDVVISKFGVSGNDRW